MSTAEPASQSQDLTSETVEQVDDRQKTTSDLCAASQRPVDFKEVLTTEIKLIVARRGAVDPPLPKKEKKEVRDTLIGLALSGGGVRSASFNLGLLQAFFRFGLLRHLDYLSTVSGGGYIGSYLSALIHDLPDDGKMGMDNPRLKKELVQDENAAGQPDRVKRFARHGRYLYHPLLFANSYLVGLVLNALALVSGLVFLCALASYLWRLIDLPGWSDWLLVQTSSLGFWSIQEWNRPLLPAALLALTWLFMWATASIGESGTPPQWPSSVRCWRYGLLAVGSTFLISLSLLGIPRMVVVVVLGLFWVVLVLGFLLRPSERGPRYALLFTVVTLFIGLAVLLATPAIDVYTSSSLPADQTNDLLIETTYTRAQRWIGSSLFGLIAIGLLPFLQPRVLLERGLRPVTWYDPWIFRFACTTLVLGIPFLLILFFARHDFSNQETQKRCSFSDTDINYRRWNAFWKKVRGEWCNECINNGPVSLPATPGGIIWQSMCESPDHLDQTIEKCIGTMEDSKDCPALTSSPVSLDPTAADDRRKVIAYLNKNVIRAVTLAKRVKVFTREWVERAAQHHHEKDRLLRLFE
jgi:hypothetical protein